MDYFVDIAQIVFADIILSGDNALVIGMAAAGFSPELRKKSNFWGMGVTAGRLSRRLSAWEAQSHRVE